MQCGIAGIDVLVASSGSLARRCASRLLLSVWGTLALDLVIADRKRGQSSRTREIATTIMQPTGEEKAEHSPARVVAG